MFGQDMSTEALAADEEISITSFSKYYNQCCQAVLFATSPTLRKCFQNASGWSRCSSGEVVPWPPALLPCAISSRKLARLHSAMLQQLALPLSSSWEEPEAAARWVQMKEDLIFIRL